MIDEKTMSDTIGKLGEALAKAQGEMELATKDSINPYFKSKYADLSSVWNTIREPLSKNGLSVVQQLISDPIAVAIRTVLIHSSGEWISSTIYIKPVQTTPQGFGSTVTYARRYALSAIVGVAPDDDDGNASVKRNNEEEVQEMNSHVSDISKQTNSIEQQKVLLLGKLIGKDKPFQTKVVDAKRWMSEQVKTDWDRFTEKDVIEINNKIKETYKL